MTDEEDERNRAENEKIRQCRHVPVTADGRRVWCRLCGARFALVLLPRKVRPTPIDWDDA